MLRNLKLITALCAFVVLMSSVFTGCTGEKDDSKVDAGATAKEPVEITWCGWTVAQTAEAQANAYNQIIENYEKISGNKVNLELLPVDQYRAWLTTNFAAGEAPEVIQSKVSWAWEDYNKGYLVKLDSYLEEESKYFSGKKWKDTFSPVLFNQVIDPANNVVSLTPTTVVVIRMFYNKDLFKKVGIDKTPETWAEFIDVSKKFKDAGIIPFAFANSKPNDYHFLWTGMSFMGQTAWDVIEDLDLNDDGFARVNEIARGVDKGIIDLRNKPYKNQFEIIKDWSQYWNRDYNSTDNQTAMQMFIRGDVAMTYMGSWELKRLDEIEGLTFEYGAFPIPTITKETFDNALGKTVVLGGMANNGYVLNAATEGEKLDAAVDFLQYLNSPDAAGIRGKELYYISTLSGVELDEGLKGFEITENEQIVLCNLYGPATSTEFFEYYQRSGQLYLSDDVSYEEYAEEMNNELKTIMDQASITNNWTEENGYGTKS